jgi:hypothetical protein
VIVRRSLLAVAAALALALALAPAAPARAPFVARLHASGHHPKANKHWWVRITVRSHSGRRLSGRVDYVFYFHGARVGHSSGHRFRGGVYRDPLVFPRRAVGVPLSVHFIVKTSLGHVSLRYWVKVRR